MIDISTYNRIPELENKARMRLLSAVAAMLLAAGVAGLIGFRLFADESLAIAFGSVILLAGGFSLFVLARRSQRICRRCGTGLQEVMRPIQVKNRHLFGDGLLIDGQIFMPNGSGRGRDQWGKLYQWSLACHHCRIYETTYHERSVPATALEMEKIRAIRNV